jgi:large subunit ribosomal protein L5
VSKRRAPQQAAPAGYMPRLKARYRAQVASALNDEFGYSSVMQTPRLDKIVLSAGVGEAANNKKLLDTAVAELTRISGLRAVRTTARKSIAAFKIRQGMEIGVMVTLRGARMYEFLDRLVSVAIPRIKDFRGCSTRAFDGHGNYSMGVDDQTIFPEIDYDKVERVTGLNIVIVTTAESDREARSLLAALGMPFQRPEAN